MVKILFLGCGKIATIAHLPALKLLQEQGVLEIAGVCDTDLEKAKAAATRFEIANFGTDWKQMVAETGANAVSLCLPPGINAELAVQALDLGLHVICEKPPGRTVAQAERMAQAAIAHPDCVTMIAFNRRHAPLYAHTFKESLKSSRPHVFYGRFTRSSMGGDPSNTMKDWITSDGSHALDLAIATVGFPDRVAVARRQVGSDTDNVWTIQLHTENGSAILLFDFTAGRRVERFEWTGPGYDVVLELPQKAEWSRTGEAPQILISSEMTGSTEVAMNYGFVGEYRYFADAIAGSCPRPEADFHYGVAFMELVKTVLECPSGELRPVLKPDLTATQSEAATLQTRSTHSQIDRPIVQIMQPPAGQARFFELEQLTQLGEHCELRLASSDRNQPVDLSDVNVLVTGWSSNPLEPAAIAQAPNLKLVISIGASVKALQPEQLLDRNVLVCNTADAIAQSVAEHCLMSALAGLRWTVQVTQRMQQGEWITSKKPKQKGKPGDSLRKSLPVQLVKPILIPLYLELLKRRKSTQMSSAVLAASSKWYDLQGQTVGLIGWGYTARHFANLLRPFNCKILIYSDAIAAAELEEFNARKASLGEILGSAKVISLHKGLTESSRGMLGASELGMIKPGSVLINTARAGLIDEAALIARLKRGDMIAALDVFNEEPLPKEHPLRTLENVILSPHNASTTPECERRVGEQALTILMDWIEGQPVPAINRDRLTKMT